MATSDGPSGFELIRALRGKRIIDVRHESEEGNDTIRFLLDDGQTFEIRHRSGPGATDWFTWTDIILNGEKITTWE